MADITATISGRQGVIRLQVLPSRIEVTPAQVSVPYGGTQQYDAVWRWIDWRDRNGKPDTGIDLFARERDTGEYTAIQCKFYEPTHTRWRSLTSTRSSPRRARSPSPTA